MPDILNVSANERLDLSDLQHVAGTSQLNFHRLLNTAFTTGAASMSVVNGFAITNPTGSQVQVALGSAMLAYRQGANVQYGVVAAEGDATKTLDLSAFAAGTYGVYIRFNYLLGTNQNRIFWNPANGGSEFAASVPTRQTANWELRVELASPGAEWLQIGTVVTPTMTITDQRPFYFEGRPDQSYASTWGGGANDRNANRAAYGVGDLRTFCAAMRTALEDVKGQGLRRWWAADIGGQCIGFVGTPAEKRIQIGDASFYADNNAAGVPKLAFNDATGAVLQYTRTSSLFAILMGTSPRMVTGTSGNSLGNATSPPAANPVNALDIVGGVAIGSYAGVNVAAAGTLIVSGAISVGASTPGTEQFLARSDTASGYASATVSNQSATSPGARLVLSTSQRTWALRNNASGYLEFYDQGGTTSRGQLTGGGYWYLGNVITGTSNPGDYTQPVTTGFDAYGPLGATSGNTIDLMHVTAAQSGAPTQAYVAWTGYRNAASTLAGTVDFYLQRSESGSNAGHTLAFLSNGTLALRQGVAGTNYLAFLSNGVAGFMMPSSNLVSDLTVPVQVNAASGAAIYFGANKAAALGLQVGFVNNVSSVTAGVLRMVTTDPLNFYVNNTQLAGQVSYSATYGPQWSMGSNAYTSGVSALNVYSTFAQTIAAFTQTTSGNDAAIQVAAPASRQAYAQFKQSTTNIYNVGVDTNGYFNVYDQVNSYALVSCPTGTITYNVNVQHCAAGGTGVGPASVGSGTMLTDGVAVYLKTTTTAYMFPLRLPAGCTITGYTVNYGSQGVGTSSTSVRSVLYRNDGTGNVNIVGTTIDGTAITAGAATTGSNTATGLTEVVGPTSANCYTLRVYLTSGDNNIGIRSITVTLTKATIAQAIRG